MAKRRSDQTEPQPSEDAGEPARIPPGVQILAMCWLVVPAVQFVATDQRMRIITGRNAPLAWLALRDFTVAYLLLLVATLIYAAVGALRLRDEVQRQ